MGGKNTQSVFFGCEQSKNVYVIKSTFVPLILWFTEIILTNFTIMKKQMERIPALNINK